MIVTVECGYHKAPHAINVARQSILNILAFYNVLDIPTPKTYTPKIITLKSFITKKMTGQFSKKYQHLDPIKQDEVLAVYNNGQQLCAPFDGYIIMPNPNAEIGTEWFYLGL